MITSSEERAYKVGLQHGKYLRFAIALFSLFGGFVLGFIVGLAAGVHY